MRNIGQVESEEQARTFVDYLYLRDIEAHPETGSPGGWSLWVVDEDRVAEAKALLSRFRSMPDAEEFHQASLAAEVRRRGAQAETRQVEQKLQRAALRSRVPGNRLTRVMQVTCIGAALATRFDPTWASWLYFSNLPLLDPLRFWESLTEIMAGQVWRLVTPVFLHFTLWHLIFNLLWLEDLGSVLENRIGTGRFAGMVLWLALVSNFCQYLAGGGGFGGLSGVIYGIFGYIWVRSRRDFQFGVVLAPMTAGLLLVFLALGIFGLLGPTANAAHFSGLVAGAVLGWAAGRGATHP